MVIAAYNEEGTISKVVRAVKKYTDDVLVVDDASLDNTALYAQQAGALIIQHSLNLGQGAALQTGFDYFTKIAPVDVVVTFDADDQFLASEIPNLVSPILANEYDVVLGSRFLGKTINMPLVRRLILKAGVLVTWLLSDIKLSDTHNGFRAFSVSALKQIEIKQNRMAHASEIIDQLGRLKLRILEVPVTVTYNSNRKGQSSWNSLHIFFDILIEKFS